MLGEVEAGLSSPDLSVRLGALSKFQLLDSRMLPKLFEIVLNDSSYEVRESAAALITLCPSLYERYLTDPDPYVRISVINQSVAIRSSLSNPASIITLLGNLVSDPIPAVRCAIASALREHTKLRIEDDFLRMSRFLLILLSDRDDDVRIAASANICDLVGVFTFDFIFDKLFDHIQTILIDLQWRVRINSVRFMCSVALSCPPAFYTQHVTQFLVRALSDTCHRVRLSAIAQLPFLVRQFGSEWLFDWLLPLLQKFQSSSNFLHRQAHLLGLSALVALVPSDYRSQFVFQPMTRALRDPVHSVVLTALELLLLHFDEIHPFRRCEEIKPILESLFQSPSAAIIEKSSVFLAKCQ
jgi:HEAT repeat protein